MFLILLLIIIVAAFNLISSMIILVSMKRKDIGVLRILGVKKNQILKIIKIKSLWETDNVILNFPDQIP